MKKTIYIITAVSALALYSCTKERVDLPVDVDYDKISAVSDNGNVTIDANKLVYNLTVIPTFKTKESVETTEDTARVELVSFQEGKNPVMITTVGGGESISSGTKAIFDQTTTRELTSNFLRIDETKGNDGSALYQWEDWSHAKLLEAKVISNPDNTNDVFYRSVTFVPTQSYSIQKYWPGDRDPEDPTDPGEIIYYHTRMVAWHPMMCKVPRDGNKASAVEFGSSQYANFRTNIDAGTVGVVFDHALDGHTDLMMSNVCEAQRWHQKGTAYADPGQTQSEINYAEPFGHNEDKPKYINPIFFKHYLSAIRLWAKVDQSGDGEQSQLNLLTWGEIKNVTFVNQPSTAIISIPNEVSSPIVKKENGDIDYIQFSRVKWGEVSGWADPARLTICGEKMFGEGDINHTDDEYSVTYPVNMIKDGLSSMETTYLGYCLVQPGEDVTIAIQTAGGIYSAIIPSTAILKMNGNETEEVDIFKESNIYDIVLNLRTAETFNDFIEEEDGVTYKNLSPYDAINMTYQSANSYIVPLTELQERIDTKKEKAGYCFIANIMGNGKSGVFNEGTISYPTSDAIITDLTNAELVWESKQGLISNIQLQHGYIRFIVNSTTEGNAVIAVTDNSGKYLWSWHIWITDKPQDIDVEITSGRTVTFMDRNLGAVEYAEGSDVLKTFGLYYQWGRKDPLPGPEAIGTTSSRIMPVYNTHSDEVRTLMSNSFGSGIEASIQNPLNYLYCDDSPYYEHNWMSTPIDFLWLKRINNTPYKTIYDPCPFGYRVPDDEIQIMVENNNVTQWASGYGVTVAGLNLPYAGYIGAERNQSSREPFFNYVGEKADYIGSSICPSSEGIIYPYFAAHRLRTYLSREASWTTENVDGANYTFNTKTENPGQHLVISTEYPNRDYTNRNTAGTVRCVKDASYTHKGQAVIQTSDRLKVNGGTVTLNISGYINMGKMCATLTITGLDMYGHQVGEPTSINLMSSSEFITTVKTYNKIEGTYPFTYTTLDNIKKYTFHLTVSDAATQAESEIWEESECVSTANSASITVYNTGEVPSGSGFTQFITVDNKYNFTGTNEPIPLQPFTMTAYMDADNLAYGGFIEPNADWTYIRWTGSVPNIVATDADGQTATLAPSGEIVTYNGKHYLKCLANITSDGNDNKWTNTNNSATKYTFTLSLNLGDDDVATKSNCILRVWKINNKSLYGNSRHSISTNSYYLWNNNKVGYVGTSSDGTIFQFGKISGNKNYPSFLKLIQFTKEFTLDKEQTDLDIKFVVANKYLYEGTNSEDHPNFILSENKCGWTFNSLSAVSDGFYLINPRISRHLTVLRTVGFADNNIQLRYRNSTGEYGGTQRFEEIDGYTAP